ncbi:hypothetical protein [Streptomyces sp. NPDC050263]|uniref:hypothetical protein n=1 Tax=Streptomyces sp. NPDC050263 TaxID=3155037 RepID=UPI003432B2E3
MDEESNSANSETVSATELDMTPSPPTPEGSQLTLTATAAAGSDDNNLSWYGLDPSAPEQAGGYRIHRWNRDTAAYERVAEVTSVVQEFIDAGAQRGTTAFYRVTALATDGTETLPAGDYVITTPVQ